MKTTLTQERIAEAKKIAAYDSNDKHHEHDDCIRIAYEWLDAQRKIKGSSSRFYQVKHLIENWGGRYVSTADVIVAGELHPDIHGSYPNFNLSANLTEPSDKRLVRIDESFRHKDKRGSHDPSKYKYRE